MGGDTMWMKLLRYAINAQSSDDDSASGDDASTGGEGETRVVKRVSRATTRLALTMPMQLEPRWVCASGARCGVNSGPPCARYEVPTAKLQEDLGVETRSRNEYRVDPAPCLTASSYRATPSP